MEMYISARSVHIECVHVRLKVVVCKRWVACSGAEVEDWWEAWNDCMAYRVNWNCVSPGFTIQICSTDWLDGID